MAFGGGRSDPAPGDFHLTLRGNVRPPVYDQSMGRVIDLEAFRRAREQDPVARLERATRRLDRLLVEGNSRIAPRVEQELLAITGAVTAGLMEDAADRAERLAERLEHPSARGTRKAQ